MNIHSSYTHQFFNDIKEFNRIDTKNLVREICEFYRKEMISEKSFKIFMGILLDYYIETKFNEKYLDRISKLDNKLAISLLKLGEHHGRR
jgi:hypothetical protein